MCCKKRLVDVKDVPSMTALRVYDVSGLCVVQEELLAVQRAPHLPDLLDLLHAVTPGRLLDGAGHQREGVKLVSVLS